MAWPDVRSLTIWLTSPSLNAWFGSTRFRRSSSEMSSVSPSYSPASFLHSHRQKKQRRLTRMRRSGFSSSSHERCLINKMRQNRTKCTRPISASGVTRAVQSHGGGPATTPPMPLYGYTRVFMQRGGRGRKWGWRTAMDVYYTLALFLSLNILWG